jgi:hypothetical protein
MSSRKQQALVGLQNDEPEKKTSAVPDVKRTPQLLGLPVLYWEYKEIFEKDERFNLVIRLGKQQVVDSWVVVHLLAPDGSEICVEVDRKPFDRVIFPLVFYPCLLFWRDMSPASPFYARRDTILPELLELKRRSNL